MFGKKKENRIDVTGPIPVTDPAGEDHGTLGEQIAKLAQIGSRAVADAGDKRKGMTLGELDKFIHGALANGAGENSSVMVAVNITGGVKSIWTREEKSVD